MQKKADKKNILCIFPGPTARPDTIDFSERFVMLSEYYNGEVYSWIDDEKYVEHEMKDFMFRGYFSKKNKASRFSRALHIIKSALRYNKKHKVDVIICYEPIFTGFIGSFLKLFFGSKLIVELNNSNVSEAILMELGDNIKSRLKIALFTILKSWTLFITDGIKILTEAQRASVDKKYQNKLVFCFHDFVPTHYFTEPEKKMEKFILFVGYPFHRKGIDLLVSAFERILKQHPDYELYLIGHRLEDHAIKKLGNWDKRVKFIKPMYYDELRKYFLDCYCFVLPSREEGMGRVLLEAMASGKAVIGANVGGIPQLIKDEVNGLLFEKENTEQLYECMLRLVENKKLAVSLGRKGLEFIEKNYSSEKYVTYFVDMVSKVCTR